jgi:hypothetical protein
MISGAGVSPPLITHIRHSLRTSVVASAASPDQAVARHRLERHDCLGGIVTHHLNPMRHVSTGPRQGSPGISWQVSCPGTCFTHRSQELPSRCCLRSLHHVTFAGVVWWEAGIGAGRRVGGGAAVPGGLTVGSGISVTAVAARFEVSRQRVHAWLKAYRADGLGGVGRHVEPAGVEPVAGRAGGGGGGVSDAP